MKDKEKRTYCIKRHAEPNNTNITALNLNCVAESHYKYSCWPFSVINCAVRPLQDCRKLTEPRGNQAAANAGSGRRSAKWLTPLPRLITKAKIHYGSFV